MHFYLLCKIFFHIMISCRTVGLRSYRVGMGKADPNFLRVYFWKIWLHNTHKLVIDIQCLQCVFYSLLSLQKHRVSVKGHQNKLKAKKIYALASKIPGSAAGWRSVQRAIVIGWRHGGFTRHTSTDWFFLKFRSSNVKHQNNGATLEIV